MARQPTKANRNTMNRDRPDQMPTRPQPNASDSQINDYIDSFLAKLD